MICQNIIIIISVIMLALILFIPLFLLSMDLIKRLPSLATYKHYWELFIVTVYVPVLWFASCILIKVLLHFMKGPLIWGS
jgi:hypothetical protein